MASEDAARIICLRSQLLRGVRGSGAMLAVGISLEQAIGALAGYADRVSVAASNSPRSTVLSGDTQALRKIAETLNSQNIFCQWIKVDVASHSPQMDSLRAKLLSALEGIRPQKGTLPFYSTVTGQSGEGCTLNAEYWVRNLCEPVLFSFVIQLLLRESLNVFLEISPHPLLLPAIEQCIQQNMQEYTLLPSLRRAEPEGATLLESLGTLYTRGLFSDWQKIYPSVGRWIPLPSYPWQYQRFERPGQEALFARHQVDEKRLQPSDRHVFRREPEDITTWLYQQEWLPAPLVQGEQSTQKSSGNWLLFLDQARVGQQLRLLLIEHGASCTLVSRGDAYSIIDSGHYAIRPTSLEDMHHLFKELTRSVSTRYTGIIYLWNLDIDPLQDATSDSLKLAQELGCISILHLIQALDQVENLRQTRLWLITGTAQRVGSSRVEALQAPVWGLGKVIAQEHPALQCTCIDISATPDQAEYQALYNEIVQNSREDQIALRSDQRFVAHLQSVPFTQTGQEQPPLFYANATYLITGGSGGIGLKLARWLTDKGAQHLVLLSRHLPAGAAERQIHELAGRGIHISFIQVDVTQQQQVRNVLAKIRQSLPPLRGVFHTAGLLDDGILLQQNKQRFEQVMAPKIMGSWHLHVLTQDLPLDFFVLFSSASSLMGMPGQGSYAAGNAFMDALVQSRFAQNQPALSVNWGPWAEVGLATRADRADYVLSRGFISMSPEGALEVLEFLLNQASPQFGVFPIKWDTFVTPFPASDPLPLLSTVLANASLKEAGQEKPELLRLLEAFPEEKRLQVLINYIKSLVASVMGLDEAHSLDIRRGFFEMGMNSLMSVDLKNRLQTAIGPEFGVLSAAMVFDYPTVESLSNYFAKKVMVRNT